MGKDRARTNRLFEVCGLNWQGKLDSRRRPLEKIIIPKIRTTTWVPLVMRFRSSSVVFGLLSENNEIAGKYT